MSTIKIVQCGHTKKCGWIGRESDFVYIQTARDTRSMKRNGIVSTTGSCPKCGGIEFYYPKEKEITP